MTDAIHIADAYENNLKHVSLTIPKGKLVVFAGVSGSGKSSLAFDTIAVESSRQWQSNYPLFLRNKMPHYERPKVESIENLTPSIVEDQHSAGTSARSTVGTAIDAAPLLRLLFSRCGKPSAGGSMAYSFNHPMGMCPDCSGLGERWRLVEERLFDLDKTLREGAIRFSQFSAGWQTYLYQANPLIDADKPLRDFSEAEWRYLKYGDEGKPVKVEIRSNNTGRVVRDIVDFGEEVESNHGSKGFPCLIADVFGDWREEMLLRRKDNRAIRVFMSAEPTKWRFHTFMEDPVYRTSVLTQNNGYNVPTGTGFYFGPDLLGHDIVFRGAKLP